MKRYWIYSALLALSVSVSASTPTVTRDESRLLEAVSELAQEDLTAALTRLNAARDKQQYSAALDYTAGRLYARREDYRNAAQAYRSALAGHPGFTAARAGLGHSLAALTHWEEAAEALRPLIRSDAAERDIMLLYAHVSTESGRMLSAETIYRNLLQSEGETPEVLYGLARSYFMQQRFKETTAVIETLISIRPRDPALWALSSDTWLARQQPDKALASLETARRLEVADPSMLVQLGGLYLARDLPDAAAAVYRETREIDHDPGYWLVLAAEGLLRAGETREAGEWLDRYLEHGGEPEPRFLRVRALWAEQTEQPETVREAYEDWIEHDPVNVDALLGIGDFERANGRMERASLWYERARDAHPSDSQPLGRLADLAVEQREYRLAADWLEHAYWLDNRPETHRAVIQLRRLAELESRPSATGETRHAEDKRE